MEICQAAFSGDPVPIGLGEGASGQRLMARGKRNRAADFWVRVAAETASGCRLWLGTVDHGGYGYLSWRSARSRPGRSSAHRLAWTLTYGQVPEGLYVLHRCDVPACVNPLHLFLGTAKDNTVDMQQKGREADRRGERNQKAMLSEHDVRAIRRMASRGVSYRAIARLYEVTCGCVGPVVRREHWPHVPDWLGDD